MGMPSWDKLGQIFGWEKRSVVDSARPSLNAANVVATSAIDPIGFSSTPISHAPHIRAPQSCIGAMAMQHISECPSHVYKQWEYWEIWKGARWMLPFVQKLHDTDPVTHIS